MAERIAAALEHRTTLVVEAGTGTGKTFAYLVPALLSGARVLISTGTRTLQDQLFTKDLPLVARGARAPGARRAAERPGELSVPASPRSWPACSSRSMSRSRPDRAARAHRALVAQHAHRRPRRSGRAVGFACAVAADHLDARQLPRASAARSIRAATSSRRGAWRRKRTSSSSITTCCWRIWR